MVEEEKLWVKGWCLILSEFVLTPESSSTIQASYVLEDSVGGHPSLIPKHTVDSAEKKGKLYCESTLNLQDTCLIPSIFPFSPHLSLLIKLELTFLRYHYYRTWTSKIISYLGESHERRRWQETRSDIKTSSSAVFCVQKSLKLSVSYPLACSIKQCQLWATILPTEVLEVHLLVHEVAWRCGETKDSLGLAVISSKEGIHVVSPILPQVSP